MFLMGRIMTYCEIAPRRGEEGRLCSALGTPPVRLSVTHKFHAEHRWQMKAMLDEMKKGGHAGHSMADITHEGGVWMDAGKTANFVWTFVRTANLEFACNIPGHYEVGMNGPIRFVK